MVTYCIRYHHFTEDSEALLLSSHGQVSFDFALTDGNEQKLTNVIYCVTDRRWLEVLV